MDCDIETIVACTTDLVNSWCRESGVPECHRPLHGLSLRDAVDRLWGKLSGEINDLRTENSKLREQVEDLEATINAARYGL